MNIRDLAELLATKLHDHTVENGELIADTTTTLRMDEVKAIQDILMRTIDANQRRARAGGKGAMTPARQAALAAMQAKGVAARKAKAAARAAAKA